MYKPEEVHINIIVEVNDSGWNHNSKAFASGSIKSVLARTTPAIQVGHAVNMLVENCMAEFASQCEAYEEEVEDAENEGED